LVVVLLGARAGCFGVCDAGHGVPRNLVGVLEL